MILAATAEEHLCVLISHRRHPLLEISKKGMKDRRDGRNAAGGRDNEERGGGRSGLSGTERQETKRKGGGGLCITLCLWSVVHGEPRQCRSLVHSSWGTQLHIPPCSFPASAKSLLVFQSTAAVKTHYGILHARKDLSNAPQCHCPASPHLVLQFLTGQTLFYFQPFAWLSISRQDPKWWICLVIYHSTEGSVFYSKHCCGPRILRFGQRHFCRTSACTRTVQQTASMGLGIQNADMLLYGIFKC